MERLLDKAFRFKSDAIKCAEKIASEHGGEVVKCRYAMSTRKTFPDGMEDYGCDGEMECVEVRDSDLNTICYVGWWEDED